LEGIIESTSTRKVVLDNWNKGTSTTNTIQRTCVQARNQKAKLEN